MSEQSKTVKPKKAKAKAKKLPVIWLFVLLLFILSIAGIALGALSVFSNFKNEQLPWQHAKAKEQQELFVANNMSHIHRLQEQLNQLNAVLVRRQQAAGANKAKQAVVSVPHFVSAKLYLQLARAELVALGNIKSANSLLLEAQHALAASGQSKLAVKVKDQLAKLKALPTTSYLQLSKQAAALKKQLASLSFRLPIDLKTNQPKTKQDKNEPFYQRALNQSWARIRGLLVIRDNQDVDKLQLTDSARLSTLAMIQYQLNLALSEADQGNWGLYAKSLKAVSAKATVAFEHNAAYQAFSEKLKAFESVSENKQQQGLKALIQMTQKQLGGE